MPCSDYGREYENDNSELKTARASIRKQKIRLDEYGKMLCFVMTNATPEFIDTLRKVKGSEEHGEKPYAMLTKWWTQHQIDDRAEAIRKAKEANAIATKAAVMAKVSAMKARARAKLTAEERQVLGLT